MSSAAEDALFTYNWPGNVRELERMMESAVVLARGHQIELADLPIEVGGGFGDVLGPSTEVGESLRAWGSRYVRLVLRRCQNNKRAACRVLDISYHTLQTYLHVALPEDATQDTAPAAAGWPASPALAVVHEGPPAQEGHQSPSGP